jgi:hypothetical protein
MFKNWKTTLVGIATGFANLALGGVGIRNIALSAGLAALGAVAKDFNVTGGTVVQPSPNVVSAPVHKFANN